MPSIEPNRVVIPFHAIYRCAERTSVSMDEATSTIKRVLCSSGTKWTTQPPKGVKRKHFQEGVHYGMNEEYGLLIVFDENDRSGNGYIPTTYGWDGIAEEAKA